MTKTPATEITKATCSKCGEVDAKNGRCTKCGRMCKGFNPTTAGLTKKKKKPVNVLSKKDTKLLAKLLKEKDMTEVAAFFTKRAPTAELAFRFVKELAPYIVPKLQNIESKVKKETDVKITIEGYTPQPLEDTSKVIEGEIAEEVLE